MVIISGSLEDEHAFVKGCNTSKEMMDASRKVYEKQSATSMIHGRQEFISYIWKTGSTVSSVLFDIKILIHYIRSLGDNITQNWKRTGQISTILLSYELDQKKDEQETQLVIEAFYENKK
jgi:hypothetical protein